MLIGICNIWLTQLHRAVNIHLYNTADMVFERLYPEFLSGYLGVPNAFGTRMSVNTVSAVLSDGDLLE